MPQKKQQTIWSNAIDHLKMSDPKLSMLIDKVGPCQLRPSEDYLKTLVQAIISQQISSKSAKTIFDRIATVIPDPWTPVSIGRLDSSFLQSCGVSQQKRNYLLSLLDMVGSGELDLSQIHQLNDDDIIKILMEVKGIGRWTAEMFLIFSLNRPDILPVADLGIKEGLKQHFELAEHPKPSDCERLTHSWKPYRSIASWYLWRMFD